MPPEAFDLAGFCVGVVERDRLLDGAAVRAGDVVVGLASSGLHANGYSLVRAIVADRDLDLRAPFQAVLQRTLGDDGARRVPARRAGDGVRDAGRRAADADADLRARGAGGQAPADRGRDRRPRDRPRHRRRAARERAARGPRASGRPRSIRRLADAVGDAPVRRPRRPRGRRASRTFNGGVGMAIMVAPAARAGTDRGARRPRVSVPGRSARCARWTSSTAGGTSNRRR